MYFRGCENLASKQPTMRPLLERLDAELFAMGTAGEIVVDDLAFLLSEKRIVIDAALSELAELGTLAAVEQVRCKRGCYAFRLEEFEATAGDGDWLWCPVCESQIKDFPKYRQTVYRVLDATNASRQRPAGRSLMRGGYNKLLFVAANPDVKQPLAIDNEWKRIQARLSASSCKIAIEQIDCWSVSVDDLRRLLLDRRPNLVHFSGHGQHQGGLNFTSVSEGADSVAVSTLAELFRLSDCVECVVLSACHSADQAATIANHVHCVVAMSGELEDQSAAEFSAGFYQGLTAGESFGVSFEIGVNALRLRDLEMTAVDCPVAWVEGIRYEVRR